MCGPEDPFSRLSCSSQGPHFKKKSQFTRPLWRKFGNFSLYSLNFCQNFSSQAPIFGNFQLTSPQIWTFLVHKPPQIWKFSVHKPALSEANISSQAPHFWNPAAHPYLKKSWVLPPPPRHNNVQMPFKEFRRKVIKRIKSSYLMCCWINLLCIYPIMLLDLGPIWRVDLQKCLQTIPHVAFKNTFQRITLVWVILISKLLHFSVSIGKIYIYSKIIFFFDLT